MVVTTAVGFALRDPGYAAVMFVTMPDGGTFRPTARR
jgi:hypothetical protein